MGLDIAIHHREGSFSNRWIEYCLEHGIRHRVVSCYANDIIRQLASARALLWHWHHMIKSDVLAASHIIKVAERMGLRVFPSTDTCWHFDDKVAQKYLLESVGAPLAPAYVFFDAQVALDWIAGTSFPKVFKLRRGAGSLNVRLVRTAAEARRLVHRAFGRGFRPVPGYLQDASTKFRKARLAKDIGGRLRRLPSVLRDISRRNRELSLERDYAYFQDFIPGNTFDTRVTVIGNRAIAYTRGVRTNDFRASGSGKNDYDPKRIDPRCITVGFEVTRKANAQSMAFDFIKTPEGDVRLVEVSYAYVPAFLHNCAGHWDSSLNWHEGHLWPQDAILLDLLEQVS